ncbi:MAG: hypothetical protein ACK4RT_05890 [Erythrobacter sp.]
MGEIAGAHQRIGSLLGHRARHRIERGAVLHPEMHVADVEQAGGHGLRLRSGDRRSTTRRARWRRCRTDRPTQNPASR